MVKVQFALDIEDGWPPVGSESVWCERIHENYQLKNVPFFISNLAFNDIFSAELDPVNDHVFEFEIVERSGHSVVWWMNNINLDISTFMKKAADMGCRFEDFPQRSIGAIDVPPNINFEVFEKLVDEYEEKGIDFAFPVWE